MLNLFFPQRCPMCGQVVADGTIICHNCIRTLPRTEQVIMRGNSTEMLFDDIKNFRQGAAFLFFDKDSPVQNALHQMKYSRFANPQIGYVLAKEAAYDFLQSEFFEGIDIILPVPLHPKRLRERGFNQSEWIARALSEATKIPMETDILIRQKDNEHQARLIRTDRNKNVKGIFAIHYPEYLYHKHILLVDDIITTGATLRACIEALKPARGHKVSVFGLGKVR